MDRVGLLFLMLFANLLYSQKANEQIEITMENDKLVLVGRYYTSGLLLSHKKVLDNDFLFKEDSTNALQLNMALATKPITPRSMGAFNTLLYDRPFAEWMFLRFEVGNAKEESAFFESTEMGITGEEPQSGHL